MPDFTPETPLGQAVQTILQAHPEGLTSGDIRRRLRLEKAMMVNEVNLDQLLRHAHVFALMGGGRYVLADQVPESDPRSAPAQNPRPIEDPWANPLIRHLPQAQTSYVVFDLETTGLDPARDRIIQIAALKVLGGEAVAVRNWYISPGDVTIPYTLQVTLGLTDNPAIAAAIQSAPTADAVLPAFLAFVESLPLVAYNARFDGRFLAEAFGAAMPRGPLVDSLELAILLLPGIANHKLATLAEALDLPVDSLSAEWASLSIDSNIQSHQVGSSSLHNAVTDVYILHRVYRELLDYLHKPSPETALIQALLPEAFDATAVFYGVDAALLAPLQARCNWCPAPGLIPRTQTFSSSEETLEQYLEARGRQPRTGQIEMQERVRAALHGDRFALIEAPTGTGKTLAYLTAAILAARQDGQPVTLSTAYRNLQDQLLGEIEDLQAWAVLPFRSVVLKGVGNYLCWSQIIQYLEDGDPRQAEATTVLSLAERFVLAYLAVWLPISRHGTVDDLSFWVQETLPVARRVIEQLKANAACRPDVQPICAACPMPATYAAAAQADILVVNHALWLTDPLRLPPVKRLVVDEAHTLEDVATSAFTQEVSTTSLHTWLNRLYDPHTNRGLLPRMRARTRVAAISQIAAALIGSIRLLNRLVADFGAYLAQFIRRCIGQIDPQYGATFRLEAPPVNVHRPRWAHVGDAHRQLFDLHLHQLLDKLEEMRAALSREEDNAFGAAIHRELDEIIAHLSEQQQLAHELIRVADQRLVYWIEVAPAKVPTPENADAPPPAWALKAAPVSIAAALQPFYTRMTSAVLVSATLALRGQDFSYIIERLGLENRLTDESVCKLPPALSYDRQVFLGLTDYLAYTPLPQTMASFQEELATELSLFLRFTDGRALGLFTARNRMQAVADRINPDLARAGIPLYVQTPGVSRLRLIDAFRTRREAVLFGLRSFWEGIDVPGDTLSFVLMEKLPFPLLADPIHKARTDALRRAGKSEFEDYMLPLMLLQFKQGFGRLLRHEQDQGAVILFDKRIHRKEYKADLLASLPGYQSRNPADERSRRRFYQALARAFPDLIDWGSKESLLEDIPDDLQLSIDTLLDRHQLPAIIPLEKYPQWQSAVRNALHEIFGYVEFRTVGGMAAQEQVTAAILAGRDVLAVLPTGAGKSLTFQLPALLRPGITVVFSPLIALMKDQLAGLNARGIEVVGAIYSGQSASERDDVLDRMRRGRARLIYVAPERLRNPLLLARLENISVTQIVVDEAHCVDMWGPSFRPDYLALPRLFERLGYRPPVAALTATATPRTQKAICRALELRNPACVVAPLDRSELQFLVYNERSRYGAIRSRPDRFKALLRILQAADQTRPPILIYVATTVEADQLARQLRIAGYDARAYHGKMDPRDRASVQELFMDDHINIVVCTKAFGMGIDKPDIRYVIHYNMPGDLESYFQEAGRAGRDGQPAYCILLYHPSDIATQTYFIEHGLPDAATINRVRAALAAQPGAVLYLDPEVFQDELGIEEVPLRVALHQLEALGYLAHRADFTLSGVLTFQVPPEEVITAWHTEGESGTEELARLLAHTRWPAYQKQEVRLLPLAEALDCGPETLDHLLLRLSLRNEAIYRSWRHGFVIEKRSPLLAGPPIPPGALAAEQHRDTLRDKLAAMRAYAEGQTRCRRASILQYFGQALHGPCGGCDVCTPNREWPWSLLTQRDVPTPDAYVDPAFLVLETVHWNLERARKYGAPYGTGTLLAVLKGDQYAAIRHETDPHMKRWRLDQLRNCPHWGVLTVLPRSEQVLDGILARLQDEGYLAPARYSAADGYSYDYLTLTPKGTAQLTSGRLLQW